MSTVRPERIRPLNDRDVRAAGTYVLYWMEQSQRAAHNPALEHAVHHANEAGVPVLVVVGLTDHSPEANLRHYTFRLEGLQETQAVLSERGIAMVVRRETPAEAALAYAGEAVVLVTDRGYLRHRKRRRRRVAERAPCRVEQVEGDVVVPVDVASDKAEYAARTLRPKIHEQVDRFLTLPEPIEVQHPAPGLKAGDGLPLDDKGAVIERLSLDRSVGSVSSLYRGGASEARRLLADFLDTKVEGYDAKRNQPETDAVSHMSKYLHAGQVSPVWLAQTIQEAEAPQDDIDAYLEELIVRRELSVNHVHFRPDAYDAYECLPDWARDTLAAHAGDEREFVYSRREFEESQTHDPYWNAAMKELRETGYMHNYMRMYWGKKILEWSPDPQTAFERTLSLNNRYFLDGRDPNSFANVAWVFGLHDRGWKERPVYGKVRYMSRGGLERKADPEAYVTKVNRIVAQLHSDSPKTKRRS
ncbi:MAG: deoxyribodipyrimidine photo-lyase [Salinivenus sp.]